MQIITRSPRTTCNLAAAANRRTPAGAAPSEAGQPQQAALEPRRKIITTPSCPEYREEITKFLVDFFRGGRCFRNLGANQFPVTLTQPMHRHLQRSFAHVQRSSYFRVGG